MKNSSKYSGRSPLFPLPPGQGQLGLLKYDCPNPQYSAWFVSFDPVDVLCKECQLTMLDTEIL